MAQGAVTLWNTSGTRWLAFVLIAAGTTLGLAGTDLILPAVPSLPKALGGEIAIAQFVIAAFVAGTAIGGGGEDERAASLTLLAIMMVASGGTALTAPFIHFGPVALATCAAVVQVLAIATLLWLSSLRPANRTVS